MAYRRFNRYSTKPTPRNITVKYAAPCACCGVTIKAGSIATYYPAGTIAGSSEGSGNETTGGCMMAYDLKNGIPQAVPDVPLHRCFSDMRTWADGQRHCQACGAVIAKGKLPRCMHAPEPITQ